MCIFREVFKKIQPLCRALQKDFGFTGYIMVILLLFLLLMYKKKKALITVIF